MCDFIGAGVGGTLGGLPGAIVGGVAGDSMGGFFGGSDGFDLQDPGLIDLAKANPELYKELQYSRGRRDNFDNFAQQYTDPARYEQLRQLQRERAMVSNTNQFANIGLAGSSAAIGAGNEAASRVDMAMIDRQLADRMRIEQMDALLSGQVRGGISGIQNSFAQFQTQRMNAYLGKQQIDQADRAAILGAAGSIGGAVLGGGMGGGGGQNTNYSLSPAPNMPNLDSGYWGSNPYSQNPGGSYYGY